ncbi:MAG TPA: hypothetical protein VFP84_09225 [Kofleriaceae bacterium]|nr:hypothetical protein [Kofleriaceae bacterium]
MSPAAPASALLLLRALDALDGDEVAAVDRLLAHQPTLRRRYEEYCDQVDARAASPLHVAPSPRVLARLWLTIDDDAAN